jgi:DNA anti-recombination protein RmuC
MEQFITENKALLNRQAELNSKFETLQTTKKTIEDLKIKKSEVEKPENSIEDLNDEILKINGKINNKLNDYTIQLKALNDILVESSSSLEQEASEIINQSISNIDAISNKQYSIIEKLSNEPVKTIYETFDERIANLTSEYNVYVEKIESIKNDLELIENKHSSIVVSFKLHELENERVFGNLRKIGEMDGVNVYVETLIREIKDKLSDFDNNIKKLIDKKKELPLFERI